MGRLLCFSTCRLCLCNIKSRLPSSQPPSRLSCCLTHSSRGLFPSPELFLPSARKMNQCLALPINARELLLSCQCRMKERAAYAPSLACCPPTLTHPTGRDSTPALSPSPQQLFPDQALAVLLLPRQFQDKPISNTQVATALHLPVWRELGAESQSRKHLVPKEKEENIWVY